MWINFYEDYSTQHFSHCCRWYSEAMQVRAAGNLNFYHFPYIPDTKETLIIHSFLFFLFFFPFILLQTLLSVAEIWVELQNLESISIHDLWENFQVGPRYVIVNTGSDHLNKTATRKRKWINIIWYISDIEEDQVSNQERINYHIYRNRDTSNHNCIRMFHDMKHSITIMVAWCSFFFQSQGWQSVQILIRLLPVPEEQVDLNQCISIPTLRENTVHSRC